MGHQSCSRRRMLPRAGSMRKECCDQLVMPATTMSVGRDRLAMSAMGIRLTACKGTPHTGALGFTQPLPLQMRDLRPTTFYSSLLLQLPVGVCSGGWLPQGPSLRDGSTIHKWTGQSPHHTCPQGQVPSTDCLHPLDMSCTSPPEILSQHWREQRRTVRAVANKILTPLIFPTALGGHSITIVVMKK